MSLDVTQLAAAPLLALVLVANVGCAADARPDEPVAETQEAVRGNVTYSGCSANEQAMLDRAMFYGRTVAASTAFKQCVTAAMSGTIHVDGFDVGPYVPCRLDDRSDPYPGDVGRVLAMTLSPNAVAMTCKSAADGDFEGSARAPYGAYDHTDPESFSWAPSLAERLADQTKPVCTLFQAPTCRSSLAQPWASLAATIWHEASHSHGYLHDGYGQSCHYPAGTTLSPHSVPYILTHCMNGVLERSASVCGDPAACGAHQLHLLQHYDDVYCYCARDPNAPSSVSSGSGGGSGGGSGSHTTHPM